jgi:hypothetical protein
MEGAWKQQQVQQIAEQNFFEDARLQFITQTWVQKECTTYLPLKVHAHIAILVDLKGA